MNILIINERLDLEGGAEVYLWAVGRELVRRGHQVSILGGVPLGKVKAPTDIGGIDVICAPGLTPDSLAERLDNVQYHVAYLQNVPNSATVDYFTNRGPAIRFVHDHYSYCPGTAKYWFTSQEICSEPLSLRCAFRAFTKRCASRNPGKIICKQRCLPPLLDSCRRLDKLIVASEYVKDQLMINGFSEGKIMVNPLFGFSEEDSELIGPLYDKPPVVLFVGRVFIEKGVEFLIRASRGVGLEHQVRIVGDGWDLARLKNLSRRLDLEHQVKFLGWQDRQRTQNEIKKSCLVVVPSMWPEPFGLVGIEAMSFGKPVVGFNSGGITQWLREGENGLVAERGSVASLATAVTRLLGDSELGAKLGRRGYRLAREEFSLSRHLDQLEALMFELSH